MKKNLLVWLSLFGVGLFLSRFLFHSYEFLFTHDHTHVARLFLLSKTLHFGQLPPVWTDLVNHGFGYPLFHFYAPLFYCFSFGLHLLPHISFTLAINLGVVFFFILGGYGVFHLLKFFGFAVAFLGAVAYLSLPYLALDIYVRGAYAELASLALLPWVIDVWFHPPSFFNRRYFFKLVLLTTCFLLSHNLIPYLALPLIVFWTFSFQPQFRRVYLFALLASFLLGSFYFLPLIFELKFTRTLATTSSTNFADHFVYLHQLWNSVWNYGGSVAGPNDGMSFKLGKLHTILALLGVLGLLKFFHKKDKYKFCLFFVFLVVISIFFSLSISKPLWLLFKPLQYLQFPWRFLGLAGLGLAVLAAASLFLFPTFLRPVLSLLFALSLFSFNLKYFHPNPVSPYLSFQAQQNSHYLDKQLAAEVPEYQPRWFKLPPQNYSFPNLTSKFNSLSLHLSLDHQTTTVLPRAFYPTWKLIVNGRTKPYFPGDYGLVAFSLPAGDYNVYLIQDHTPLEKLAGFISLFTLISLLVYVYRK